MIDKERVKHLYQDGLTLQQIGDKLGCTRERARQILEQLGVPKRDAALKKVYCKECREFMGYRKELLAQGKAGKYCSPLCILNNRTMRLYGRRFESPEEYAQFRRLRYNARMREFNARMYATNPEWREAKLIRHREWMRDQKERNTPWYQHHMRWVKQYTSTDRYRERRRKYAREYYHRKKEQKNKDA